MQNGVERVMVIPERLHCIQLSSGSPLGPAIFTRRQDMEAQTKRAKIVALGILLAFTVTVYFGWRTNQEYEDAIWIEHATVGQIR